MQPSSRLVNAPPTTPTTPSSPVPLPDPAALAAMLFEHAPAAVEIYSANGALVSVNPTFRVLFGGAPPDGYDVLADPQIERAGYADVLRRAFAGETGRVPATWYGPRAFGAQERRALEVTFGVVRDPSGAVTHVVLAQRDFTSMFEARAIAEEEQSFLRGLLEEAPIGIAFWDRELRFQRVNLTLSDLNGLPVEAHLGRTVAEVLPDVSPAMTKALRSVLDTGHSLAHEVSGRTPAAPGRQRWWHVQYYPVRVRGEVVGVGATWEEITEERESAAELARLHEQEARARAEAEAASRLKDDFLAVVSHELRTPLSAILGWSKMLKTGELPPASVSRAVDTIERNARLQVQLIDDLLDLARVGAGTLRLDLAQLDLRDVVEAAIDGMRPPADAKGLRLHAVLAPISSVLADGARLQQVVNNLLSNAVKFTPAGGSVEISLRQEDGEIVLLVADDGEGITREFLPHVFERFRQAEPSATRVRGGLGIGLAVTRHLVDLHGGRIEARSEGKGRGAQFEVRVPSRGGLDDVGARPPGARVRTSDRAPRRELEGVRMLVVDDSPDARELLAEILGARGAVVRIAPSVAAALDVLSGWLPQVLLSDVAMPGATGYDLVRALRSRPVEQGARIPAIAVTAYVREEDRVAALKAGFDAHFGKPLDPDAIVARVRAMLAERATT